MAKNNMLVWLIVGVAVYFVISSGALTGMFSSGDSVVDKYPSDMTTTITLNTGDELATSATAANVSYYVFTASGDYLKEGTTSSGTASFDVPAGGEYKMIVFYDEGGTDYLPVVKTFSTDGTDPTKRAVQTVNIDLKKESAASISSVRDPIDLNSNITVTAGNAIDFDVLIKAATAHAAVRKPIILVDVNSSEWQDVAIGGLSEVSCPDRLSVSSGHKFYCFQSSNIISSDSGVVMFSGTLYADSVNSALSGSKVGFKVIDEGIYLEPNYKTLGFSGFKYGPENTNDDSDVGAADSSYSYLTVD